MQFTFHYGQIYYIITLPISCKRFLIYIPLWLDLLLHKEIDEKSEENDLHSTMVRFIMNIKLKYGKRREYLHSTMVRFIIVRNQTYTLEEVLFTFHYGQIYYRLQNHEENCKTNIYIPLWLDLLSIRKTKTIRKRMYLHSTMVRFIIDPKYFRNDATLQFTFHYGQIYYGKRMGKFHGSIAIYIPLWLDLLSVCNI